MAIPVTVGPEFDTAQVARADAAWQALAAAEPSLAARFACTFKPCGQGIGRTVAASGLKFDGGWRPLEGILILGERFFASSEADRVITLMHEAIHVVLHWTKLRERTTESERLRQAEAVRLGPDPSPFELVRYNGAKLFRLFVDEVFAEQYLQRRCPGHAAARIARYRRLREEKRRNALDGVPAELCGYALLYEIVCNDLGMQISSDDQNRAAFAALAAAGEADLRREPTDVDSLLAVRPRLLAADVDRPPYDFTPYDEMWNRVLRTPPAA